MELGGSDNQKLTVPGCWRSECKEIWASTRKGGDSVGGNPAGSTSARPSSGSVAVCPASGKPWGKNCKAFLPFPCCGSSGTLSLLWLACLEWAGSSNGASGSTFPCDARWIWDSKLAKALGCRSGCGRGLSGFLFSLCWIGWVSGEPLVCCFVE